jgi:hypothetical protein
MNEGLEIRTKINDPIGVLFAFGRFLKKIETIKKSKENALLALK